MKIKYVNSIVKLMLLVDILNFYRRVILLKHLPDFYTVAQENEKLKDELRYADVKSLKERHSKLVMPFINYMTFTKCYFISMLFQDFFSIQYEIYTITRYLL